MRRAEDDDLLQRARAVVADLESELAGVAESTATGPDDEHDAEGSTVGYERARVGALLAAARRRLADLERLADPDRLAFASSDPERGRRCAACGEPIPAERLAALPTTSRCVRCAAVAGGSARPGGLRSESGRAGRELAPRSRSRRNLG